MKFVKSAKTFSKTYRHLQDCKALLSHVFSCKAIFISSLSLRLDLKFYHLLPFNGSFSKQCLDMLESFFLINGKNLCILYFNINASRFNHEPRMFYFFSYHRYLHNNRLTSIDKEVISPLKSLRTL